ncbi:MAG: Eco57I restriction-modification methylase domain-containing protein [Acidobacteriia bacterium]|nr:Eco57I restriction-modification methylase domain-containing protein [Terriglobia bacterium]
MARLDLLQPSFPSLCPVTAAIAELAHAGVEERGAIFTRREVVDFILDLVGYTADRPLHRLKLLEPSFGEGDFLLPAIERLVDAWANSPKSSGDPSVELLDSIRAVELHRATFERTGSKVVKFLEDKGIGKSPARALADRWLINGDFLLVPLDTGFSVVAGNPPYVRQELIPDVLMTEYRARYSTVYDRADLYIPFIERSLRSLVQGGQLGFICADRWMKNRYGGPLRKLVSDGFHLKVFVDMVNTPAFHTDVIAYPAITVISREKASTTRIAHQPAIEKQSLSTLARELLGLLGSGAGEAVRELAGVVAGAEPWILDSADQLRLVRRLEDSFPTVEEAGCKVGIGVATGADKAFIGGFDELDVEPDRKLPLAMTRDILDGVVKWRGRGVINPFADDGGLVDLDNYPRLKRYLEARKVEIAGRHVAQKAPLNWYRTIDRIYPALAQTPKLLIPDIKGEAHVVYEGGQLYPHHNLYYLTSDTWDLKALQAVLLSGIARLFVSIYSTKMRGGYLRFQAQYLRRIRLPHWDKVPSNLKRDLIEAAERGDVAACNLAVFSLYGLTKDERVALGGNGE